MAEPSAIGNDEPWHRIARHITRRHRGVVKEQGKMTKSAQPMAIFTISGVRVRCDGYLPLPLSPQWLGPPVLPTPQGQTDRRMGGAYDGIWNVLIIAQAGQLRSDQQLSVPDLGRPHLIGRRRRRHRRRRPRRRCCGADLGRRLGRHRQRQARRRFRRGPLERQRITGGRLQRPLAGDAGLNIFEKEMARQIVRRAVFRNSPMRMADANQRGARTITTWRPSKRASCSTLAISATSLLTLSRSLVPIS